jgi:hypothetical protein
MRREENVELRKSGTEDGRKTDNRKQRTEGDRR